MTQNHVTWHLATNHIACLHVTWKPTTWHHTTSHNTSHIRPPLWKQNWPPKHHQTERLTQKFGLGIALVGRLACILWFYRQILSLAYSNRFFPFLSSLKLPTPARILWSVAARICAVFTECRRFAFCFRSISFPPCCSAQICLKLDGAT